MVDVNDDACFHGAAEHGPGVRYNLFGEYFRLTGGNKGGVAIV